MVPKRIHYRRYLIDTDSGNRYVCNRCHLLQAAAPEPAAVVTAAALEPAPAAPAPDYMQRAIALVPNIITSELEDVRQCGAI